MQSAKRIIVATISGVVFGFVCMGFASSGPEPMTWALGANIVLSRTLMGFAIGISSLTITHWSIHGLVMGFLFTLPMAFGAMMAPEHPGFSRTALFISTMVMGMIYGFLTEVITTVLFKAKMTV